MPHLTLTYSDRATRRADIVFALVRQIRANRDILGLDVAGLVVEELVRGEWEVANSIIDPDAMSDWSTQFDGRYNLKSVDWKNCSWTAQVRTVRARRHY